jgi:hypothetical protein
LPLTGAVSAPRFRGDARGMWPVDGTLPLIRSHPFAISSLPSNRRSAGWARLDWRGGPFLATPGTDRRDVSCPRCGHRRRPLARFAAPRTPDWVGNLPRFAINAAWCAATTIAVDLIAWLQLIGLNGDLAKAEPKRLRYRNLHTAARLVHGQRRRLLSSPATWPWATQITAAFHQITAVPAPRLTSSAAVPTAGGPRRRRPPPRQTAHHHARIRSTSTTAISAEPKTPASSANHRG